MRAVTLLATLLTPLAALAALIRTWGSSYGLAAMVPPSEVIGARQGAVVTPPPCVAINPPPDEEATKARFDEFAAELTVRKNLTAAFEYISASYKNHNPLAEDGPNAALDVLGPLWSSTQITPLRTAFKNNQGWLNYEASGMGEVVDRFRWEAGCIVEHWDQGERFPEELGKREE
ncbi:hypothetical protein F4779DRAFT_283594 [Xylariaceae sp. FL0662B]|nr:hypothetical protein F4779DRAFT_283594 [Xylariaceae sp. FL0662B]